MKLLPYQDKALAEYRTKSVQEFQFALSGPIRKQVFYTTFVDNIKNSIKSTGYHECFKTTDYATRISFIKVVNWCYTIYKELFENKPPATNEENL